MTKQPICPHCNTEYNIDKHEAYHLYNTDDIEEVVCGSCEKDFFVRVYATHSFETEKDIDNF